MALFGKHKGSGKKLLRGYECGTKSAPGVGKAKKAKAKGKRNFKKAHKK